MSGISAETLLQELEAFNKSDVSSIPDDIRGRLSAAARAASIALETPAEVVSRVLISQPVEEISVRIAADLKLFSALAGKTLTTAELAQSAGAEATLLDRILRALSAFGAVKEVGPHRFTSAPNYALFRDPSFEAAFGGCQDILNKVRQAIPGHLASTAYRNPTDPTDAALQYAYGTKGKGFIESLLADPASAPALHSFSVLMSVWADGFTQMSAIYPVEDKLARGFDPESVMFVDVGGGLGQKAISLKKAFPELPGRFVVQDTPQVIGAAPKDDPSYRGIEMMVHDFMTPQPIKGARCYYIRQCLHNWPDSTCVAILQQLKEAAKPGYSKILIHEIIVPEIGSGPWIVSQDFNMMSMFAVAERTEEQWRALCEKAGLKVSAIFLDEHPSREGIIEAST